MTHEMDLDEFSSLVAEMRAAQKLAHEEYSRRRAEALQRRVDDALEVLRRDWTRGVVMGRAVPWTAPTLIAAKRGGGRRVASWDSRYRAYTHWIHTVRAFAALHRPPGGPIEGPVSLRLRFFLRPGSRTPDTTNIQKAFEDGLNTEMYIDDRQVCDVHSTRIIDPNEPERVEFAVRPWGEER